jgi:glycerol-3-phosphate acyltransferase PlsY
MDSSFYLWPLIGYLAGSIPFGIVIARAMRLGDLRNIGSGNIGATNVLRTGNKTAAFLTLLCDAAKGAVVILIARNFVSENTVQFVALAALIGHCFPIWLRFKGGKGVATFLGIAWALSWQLGLACCVTWLVIALIYRYSSLAGMLSAGLAPAYAIYFGQGNPLILMLMGALVYARHWENIKRLRARTETKIGAKAS